MHDLLTILKQEDYEQLKEGAPAPQRQSHLAGKILRLGSPAKDLGAQAH